VRAASESDASETAPNQDQASGLEALSAVNRRLRPRIRRERRELRNSREMSARRSSSPVLAAERKTYAARCELRLMARRRRRHHRENGCRGGRKWKKILFSNVECEFFQTDSEACVRKDCQCSSRNKMIGSGGIRVAMAFVGFRGSARYDARFGMADGSSRKTMA